MKKRNKNLADWKKEWQNSTDLTALDNALNHIDELYEMVRNSIGRILMSAEMIEIQEILEHKIDELELSAKVAA